MIVLSASRLVGCEMLPLLFRLLFCGPARRCRCSVVCRCCSSFGGVGLDFSVVGGWSNQMLLFWLEVHVFFSSPDHLQRSPIIISLISFSAADAIRTCSFAHLIAVALCKTHSVLPSTPSDNCKSHPVALRLMDSLALQYNTVFLRSVVASHGSGPSNHALSDHSRTCPGTHRC